MLNRTSGARWAWGGQEHSVVPDIAGTQARIQLMNTNGTAPRPDWPIRILLLLSKNSPPHHVVVMSSGLEVPLPEGIHILDVPLGQRIQRLQITQRHLRLR